jgi:hypothetical protein
MAAGLAAMGPENRSRTHPWIVIGMGPETSRPCRDGRTLECVGRPRSLLQALPRQLQPQSHIYTRAPGHGAGRRRDFWSLPSASVPASTFLPAISVVTLGNRGTRFLLPHTRRSSQTRWLAAADCQHGDWSPDFSPLLFGVSAYLGFVASFLRRADNRLGKLLRRPVHAHHWAKRLLVSTKQSAGHKAVATVVAAFFNGFRCLVFALQEQLSL